MSFGLKGDMMNHINEELLQEADYYCRELSKHEVLQGYWDSISLVLKGSTARGTADIYSDIDLVFFCSDQVREAIIDSYYKAGIIDRRDGVFLPLPDWIGHYHIESYAKLSAYFQQKSYEDIWEYSHVKILHDAHNTYASIIKTCTNESRVTIEDIKGQYLSLQLDLDWLRHPLKRGDEMAVYVYGARLLRKICQAYYLLDEGAYPNDKWLFYHLKDTTLGSRRYERLLDYSKNILQGNTIIPKGLELESYEQYKVARELIVEIGSTIQERYGDYSWIEEWYLYV